MRGAVDTREPVYVANDVAVDDVGNSIVRVVLDGATAGYPVVAFQLTADACERLGRALLAAAWCADVDGSTIGRALAVPPHSEVDWCHRRSGEWSKTRA